MRSKGCHSERHSVFLAPPTFTLYMKAPLACLSLPRSGPADVSSMTHRDQAHDDPSQRPQ